MTQKNNRIKFGADDDDFGFNISCNNNREELGKRGL